MVVNLSNLSCYLRAISFFYLFRFLFFQMMMLATVVEGRMIDINPYGQPGVEYYKKHMKNILYG